MRYSESRERSGELLRMVLPLMASQDAGFHPLSYALWYEHVAGLNEPLTQVLEKRLEKKLPLSELDVARFHAEHILGRDLQALDGLQTRLRALLQETVQSTEVAGAEAGHFGQMLQQRHAQLAETATVGSVAHVVAQLLGETLRMQSVTQKLSQQLEASAKEVDLLNERLERAETQALIDPLTGLKNRRGLDRTVASDFGEPPDLEGVAALMADIDHFKKINDSYGHLLGDKVIRAVGQVLHSNIKGRDIAARVGGEEFAVLLRRTTERGAMILAEQIRQAISNGRIQGGGARPTVSVTISLGIAVGVSGEALTALLARADEALYAAKRAGRNRVICALAKHATCNTASSS